MSQIAVVGAVVIGLAACGGGDEAASTGALILPPATTGAVPPPPATPPPTPASTAVEGSAEDEVLAEGSSGAAVKALQEALAALGFQPGPADGAFGTKTRKAVVAFQRRNGLTPDGIVGAQTAKAITDGLAARSESAEPSG